MIFQTATSSSFNAILPSFDIEVGVLRPLVDADRYDSVVDGFGRMKDLFVFAARGYDDARFRKDRASYGDRSFHEWSVARIAPEFLISDEKERSPNSVFAVCCDLARDLAKRIEAEGVREMAFMVSMTPASEDLDQDAYTFRLVTGREGVVEFAVIMGDQPQLVLIGNA